MCHIVLTEIVDDLDWHDPPFRTAKVYVISRTIISIKPLENSGEIYTQICCGNYGASKYFNVTESVDEILKMMDDLENKDNAIR